MVNCANAIRIAEQLMEAYPIMLFTPQLSVLHQLVVPRSHAEWLDYDFNIIANSLGILRIPGDSVGADMETRFAESLDIPVFSVQLSPHSGLAYLGKDFEGYLDTLLDAEQFDILNEAAAEAQLWGDDQYTVRYAAARV